MSLKIELNEQFINKNTIAGKINNIEMMHRPINILLTLTD